MKFVKETLKIITGAICGLVIALIISYATLGEAQTRAIFDVANRAFFVATGSQKMTIGTGPSATGQFELIAAGTPVAKVYSSGLAFESGDTIAVQEATAGSACSGTLTANGTTPVVVTTTCAKTGARIFLTRTSAESTAINPYISAISNGVSFSFTSEAADTGTFNWFIIHEAP